MKFQRMILKAVQKGKSLEDLEMLIKKKKKKLFPRKHLQEILDFLYEESYLREKIRCEKDTDFWYQEDLSAYLTEKGHRFGKVNWEKILNWVFTILGLGVALFSIFYTK